MKPKNDIPETVDTLYEKMEQLNREKLELKQNPALVKQERRNMLKQAMTSGKAAGFYTQLRRNWLSRSGRQKTGRLVLPENDRNAVDYHKAKIAVWTIAYERPGPDTIAKHLLEFSNVDYILYVPNPDEYAQMPEQDLYNLYQIRPIPAGLLEDGLEEAAAYLKTHPGEFFEGYDYAIYLDPDIRIAADVRKMINRISWETGLAMHNQAWADDLYEESNFMAKTHPSKSRLLEKQMLRYKGAGFPRHFGLYDPSVIAVDLKNPKALYLLDAWHLERIKSGCPFPQLTWSFVLWENDVVFEEIGNLGNNILLDALIECRIPR